MTLRDKLVPVIERHLERSRGCDPASDEPRSHWHALMIHWACIEGGAEFGVWNSEAEKPKIIEFQDLSKKLSECFAIISPQLGLKLTTELKKIWRYDCSPVNSFEHGISYALKVLSEHSGDAIQNTLDAAQMGEPPGSSHWRAAAIFHACRQVWLDSSGDEAPHFVSADTSRETRGPFENLS